MCTCGIPNKANYHLEIIYTDDETGSSDVYLCADHVPNVPDDGIEYSWQDDPYTFGEWAQRLLPLLAWDGSDSLTAHDIHAYTLTELRP